MINLKANKCKNKYNINHTLDSNLETIDSK